jgi:hypothetical protein
MNQLINNMNKITRRWIKWISGIIVSTMILAIYGSLPYKTSDELHNAQNNLISASGILAGILIAFLSTKLFQLADDRNKSKILLNEYADKLTPFRKLLFRIMKSHEFWVYKDHITRFKQAEPRATFLNIHAQDEESSALRQKYWLKEQEPPIYHTTIDLYLAMEEIAASSTKDGYWTYDESVLYEYDLEYLRRAEMPANQIWYYLENRYSKHTVGQINDTGISSYELGELTPLIASIDPMFKGRDFDRHVVAEIGTYFCEKIFPEMIRLTARRAQKLTSAIKNMFLSLIAVLASGVMLPLVLQVLDLGEKERLTTTLCVTTVIVSLIVFLVDLFGLAMDDEQSITDKDRMKVKPIRV